MDTNAGRFVKDAPAQPGVKTIEVGEILSVKGEQCEVMRIEGRFVVLKLLSTVERETKSPSVSPGSRKQRRIRVTRERKATRKAARKVLSNAKPEPQ